MLCTGEQFVWAGQILESLGDTTTPTGSVVNFLKNNLWQLNSRLGTEFVLSGECITPDMSQAISGIYNEIYYCNYLTKISSQNLANYGTAWVEIVGDDQGSLRRANPVEISKAYRTLAKDCAENLQKLIDWYNGSQATFSSQVLYGDRFGGSSFDLLPPLNYYSPQNFVWNNC